MDKEPEQGKQEFEKRTSSSDDPPEEIKKDDQTLEACKELIVHLRGTNQCLKKQCKTPMGEIVSLLTIQHLCKEEGQISVSAIGEKMHLSRPAVSRMIHNLKRKGYIEFHQGLKDHRYLYIVLTEEGKHLIHNEMNRCMALMQNVSQKMGREDMERFLYYSRRFFSILADI